MFHSSALDDLYFFSYGASTRFRVMASS